MYQITEWPRRSGKRTMFELLYKDNKDKPCTREQYLTVKCIDNIVREQGAASIVDLFMVKEAVASTAIEHPEWNMNEVKSYEEWEKGE